jgi:hypothetical protein
VSLLRESAQELLTVLSRDHRVIFDSFNETRSAWKNLQAALLLKAGPTTERSLTKAVREFLDQRSDSGSKPGDVFSTSELEEALAQVEPAPTETGPELIRQANVLLERAAALGLDKAEIASQGDLQCVCGHARERHGYMNTGGFIGCNGEEWLGTSKPPGPRCDCTGFREASAIEQVKP